MDIDSWGVALLWLTFLWPFVISAVYLLLKGPLLDRSGKFFLKSVAAGYLALGASNAIGLVLVLGLAAMAKMLNVATDTAIYEGVLCAAMAILTVIIYWLPVAATRHIAKSHVREHLAP